MYDKPIKILLVGKKGSGKKSFLNNVKMGLYKIQDSIDNTDVTYINYKFVGQIYRLGFYKTENIKDAILLSRTMNIILIFHDIINNDNDIKYWISSLNEINLPKILVLTKYDLVSGNIQNNYNITDIVKISSKICNGINELIEKIINIIDDDIIVQDYKNIKITYTGKKNKQHCCIL